jgi:outer membrane protein OmpA-like peptidoglycan-associated protein
MEEIYPVKVKVFSALTCVMLIASLMYAETAPKQIPNGKKAKVTGEIMSRDADMLTVQDKDGNTTIVDLGDNTQYKRVKGAFRLRRQDMDAAAMLPGLTISAEGVGNAQGQLAASKITFNPDMFNIAMAQYQQSQANKQAAASAQTTANQGVQQAQAAQASANQAQSSANAAGDAAVAAGTLGLMNAHAVEMVNERVSDLGEYKTVAEAGVYFATGQSALDAAAKADLDKLAQIALSTEHYMIEVAGYASSTGTQSENQRLSDQRATSVVQYLRNKGNIPMRRFLVPAGYGENKPAATNTDAQGRALNQRVDVKVIVNKGLSQGM